jgi:hypothetical protein
MAKKGKHSKMSMSSPTVYFHREANGRPSNDKQQYQRPRALNEL